jgi:hypothetical protein
MKVFEVGKTFALRVLPLRGLLGNPETEAIAWSENGNHPAIYTTGIIAKEADDELKGALRELKLMPDTSETVMRDER